MLISTGFGINTTFAQGEAGKSSLVKVSASSPELSGQLLNHV